MKTERALKACGHRDWLLCWACGEYGPPDIEWHKTGVSQVHYECWEKYIRDYARAKEDE